MKKWIILILILVFFSGCVVKQKTENLQNENTAPIAPDLSGVKEIAIDSIIFTRTGIEVKTTDTISQATVTISGNETIIKKRIEGNTSNFSHDLQWIPDTRYDIEIVSKEGTISSSAYSSGSASPLLIREVKLEDITPENISQGWSNVKGSVKFSPDGKIIALGSDDGFIRVFDLEGNQVWEKKIAGNISALAFSLDSRQLFAGERSQDANIYSFDARSGDEQWKYGAARVLGTDLKYQPAISRIKVSDDSMYVVASRYLKKNQYSLVSRIYRFDLAGSLQWKMPPTNNYFLSINWLDVSKDGQTIVYATGDWTNSLGTDATIYSIDKDARKQWSYTIKPLKPYFTSASVWQGIAVSDDSITAMTGDGRAYLFSNENASTSGSYEWKADIGTPIEVTKIPIYAYGDSAIIAGEELLYLTGYTFPAYYPNKAPMEHPNATSLIAYDKQGNFSWNYKIDGYSRGIQISRDNKYVALAVGKNIITKDPGSHGVYVLNLERKGGASSKLEWIYQTEGAAIAADISPDGKYIAAIEAPVKLENGDMIGEHRMIILT
jgi:WD40 repeat protein